MILHWSPRSPFVRRVMVFAHETGLVDRLERRRTVVGMTKVNADLRPDNPLNKIPTLIMDDGAPLYDSTVICEYLDTLHGGRRLFPAEGKARWTALRRSALGQGLLDLLIMWRNERERAQPAPDYLDAFAAKYEAVIAALENEVEALATTPFDIAHVTIGCALSYLDFRFPDLAWRPRHPKLAAWHAAFAQRPSVRATEPCEG